MGKFIRNILLFSLLVFILDKAMYPLRQIRPCFEEEQRLTRLLENKLSADLLIIGSSRGNKGIVAWVLEEELDLRVYNLSYRGSEVEFHTFLLKQILASESRPKAIIKVVDDDFELQFNPTNQFRVDMLYPLVKYEPVRRELIRRGKRNWLLSKLSITHQIGKSRFRTKCLPASSDSIQRYGVVPTDWGGDWSPDWQYAAQETEYDVEKELVEKVEAFNHFQELAAEAGIPLILIIPPSFKPMSTQFVDRIKGLAPGTPIITYDENDPVYSDSNYFMDRVHLNRAGAIHYSEWLATTLNEQGLIPD